MAILLPTPVTQSANFSEFWINNITIIAPSPTQKANARITMTPFDPTSGLQQAGASQSFVIADLFGAASADPTTGATVQGAIQALITAVNAVAVQKGLAASS